MTKEKAPNIDRKPDLSQNKWTPLFGQTTKRLKLSTTCMFTEVSVLDFASRQFGTQFLDLYNQVFLS